MPTDNKNRLNYQQDSDTFADEKEPKTAKLVLYIIFAAVVFAFLWATFVKIELHTVAEGLVIPSENLQVIQSLEGGIVKEIFVKEGQIVKKNDVLIRLDDTQFKAVHERDVTQRAVLQANIARLTAEAHDAARIDFPAELKNKYPKIIQAEQAVFSTKKTALQEKISSLHHEKALTEKELNLIKPLVTENIISEVEQIRLEKELTAIQARLQHVKSTFKENVHTELKAAKDQLALLQQQLPASKDRVTRTLIRAPIDSIVNQLNVSTVGQIIAPGEKLLELVPISENLTIEGKIKPNDIGFIRVGQQATIKVLAYDYTVYGGLTATVTHISPTTVTTDKNEKFYKIKLQTEKNYLSYAKKTLPIIPGMTVSVNMIAGKQSILALILKPFLRAKAGALRES